MHASMTDLEEIQAPWNKLIFVQEAVYEGGYAMLRLRIREGKRFTDLELDADTAAHLADVLSGWSAKQPKK